MFPPIATGRGGLDITPCHRPTFMILATKVITSPNFSMSTSKCFRSFRRALSVTILHRSRTAGRLRRYPAGSSCGSGGLGRSILGMWWAGEKGVSGVLGPLVPPEVRFRIWRWVVVAAGDWREEVPDFRDALDCDVDNDGLVALAALSFRENRPIAA